MTADSSKRESHRERTGDNLYPVQLTQTFGEHELNLDVPAGVWNPTPHGEHLGNMLLKLDFTGEHVLELGTGCGIHAILLAKRGAARLTLTEIGKEINDNALHNLAKHGIDIPVETMVADWIQVPGGPYDTLVTNPPFVASGKRYRRYFMDNLVLEAHKLVRPGGRLIFVQSSMAGVPRTMSLMADNGMSVRVIGETSGPFRPYYFDHPEFITAIAKDPSSYFMVDGVHHERLTVLEATLP